MKQQNLIELTVRIQPLEIGLHRRRRNGWHVRSLVEVYKNRGLF